MLEFDESDFPEVAIKKEPRLEDGGKFDLPNDVYHKSAGISNSGLVMVGTNASDYIWSKNAPRIDSNSSADFGSAFHTTLLEPDLVDEIKIAPTKGRVTDKFAEFASENSEFMVLTQSEHDQLRMTVGSAMAHPTINKLLTVPSDKEKSIYVKDEATGMLCKIRPDIDYYPHSKKPILADLKSTASIDDWYSNLRWKNPLWKFSYGHQAAFYLHVASQHYDVEFEEFIFIVASKSQCMGSYPVGTFVVTKDELVEWGFWSEMESNLKKYKKHYEANNWFELGKFNIE